MKLSKCFLAAFCAITLIFTACGSEDSGSDERAGSSETTGENTSGDKTGTGDTNKDATGNGDDSSNNGSGSGEGTGNGTGNGDGSGSGDGSGTSGNNNSGTNSSGKDPLKDFIEIVSAAVCEKVVASCDEQSQSDFFAGIVANESFKDMADDLPPKKTGLTKSECETVMRKVYNERPFGKWLAAVAAGDVKFNEAGFNECIKELEDAKTGDEIEKALFNGQCFSFQPPIGGSKQRKMFTRDAADGAKCTLLNDGFGGIYYGTCNAAEYYCCYNDLDVPNSCSTFPGKFTEGKCVKAADVGEKCGVDFVKKRRITCKTGLECNTNNICEAPLTTKLSKGASCYDQNNYKLLGICEKGTYCDVLGSKICEAELANGSACTTAEECESNLCSPDSKTCEERLFCSGN